MADGEARPAISVVIASWSGEVALRRCLESVLPQTSGADVIVVFRDILNAALLKDDRFRNVRFVRASIDATVFQLRSLGVQETRGASIALIEDHSVVCPGWFQALVGAQATGLMICGGPIDNDPESNAYDWALYFAEYVRFMPPVENDDVAILSGANIFYDRTMLWSCHSIWESCFYETDVNAALVNAGHKLHMLPNAVVTSRLRMKFTDAMRHLFHGGIHFGSFRKSRSHPFRKCFWVFVSPALPVVMLMRVVAITGARCPDRLFQLFRALPYLLLLLCAWSLGEATGYLRNTRSQDVPTQALKDRHADRN
jgi:glycosyltransferase involved in cell wall biosynthesis